MFKRVTCFSLLNFAQTHGKRSRSYTTVEFIGFTLYYVLFISSPQQI